ncbi:gypsy type transposase, partial [Tanacetum coccineum]
MLCRDEHDQLFTEFNVGAALQMSLSAEEAEAAEAIRLRIEASKLEAVKKSLQDEVQALRENNATLEKDKNDLDVKVADLAASVKVREHEVADLDVVVTSIKSQNDNLVAQVHELETSSARLQEKVTVYEDYMGQLERFQDERMKFVNDKFDKLYTNFIEMSLHLEEKFYPHLLTTIAGRSKAIEKGMQDGLAAGITHGKEGRVLTDVAAYNPSTKVDYISALQQLQNVNYSLLAELKLNKDSSVETLMNILHLEETLAERLGLNESQPHVDQLMVPIHHSLDQTVVGATALSLALNVSSSRARRIKDNITNHRSALHDVFIPLAEPFSTAVLIGTEGTSRIVPGITTALFTTFASASLIPPISTDDYEI